MARIQKSTCTLAADVRSLSVIVAVVGGDEIVVVGDEVVVVGEEVVVVGYVAVVKCNCYLFHICNETEHYSICPTIPHWVLI